MDSSLGKAFHIIYEEKRKGSGAMKIINKLNLATKLMPGITSVNKIARYIIIPTNANGFLVRIMQDVTTTEETAEYIEKSSIPGWPLIKKLEAMIILPISRWIIINT